MVKPKLYKLLGHNLTSLVIKGCKVSTAAAKYNIPRSTIVSRIKNPESSNKPGPATYLTTQEEMRLVGWIKEMQDRGFPVHKEQLLCTVQSFIKESKRPTPFKDGKPGELFTNPFYIKNEPRAIFYYSIHKWGLYYERSFS
jgi:hypothetical protein